MEQGAVQFVQADIVRTGGVTEWVKIAAIADSYGLPMCPHATTEIAASLVAAVPNGLFVECFRFAPPPKGFIGCHRPDSSEKRRDFASEEARLRDRIRRRCSQQTAGGAETGPRGTLVCHKKRLAVAALPLVRETEFF